MLLYLLYTRAASADLLYNARLVCCRFCLEGLGRVQDKLSMDKHSWQALVFFQWCGHVYLGGGEINAAWAVSVKLKEGEMHVGNNLQKNKAPRATPVPCPACFPCPKQNLRTEWCLCLHRLCQPEGTSHGDPEEPGCPCQSPGTDPVSYRWAWPCAPSCLCRHTVSLWVPAAQAGRKCSTVSEP